MQSFCSQNHLCLSKLILISVNLGTPPYSGWHWRVFHNILWSQAQKKPTKTYFCWRTPCPLQGCWSLATLIILWFYDGFVSPCFLLKRNLWHLIYGICAWDDAINVNFFWYCLFPNIMTIFFNYTVVLQFVSMFSPNLALIFFWKYFQGKKLQFLRALLLGLLM